MKINADFLQKKLPDLKGTDFSYVTRFDITPEGEPGIALELRYDGQKLYEAGFELYLLPLVHAYCNDEIDPESEYTLPTLDKKDAEHYTGKKALEYLNESFESLNQTFQSIAEILDSTGIVPKPTPQINAQVDVESYDHAAVEAIRNRMMRRGIN